MREETFDELWASAPRATATFDPERIAHLPEPARRYLEHTLAPGAPLSTAVRLRMHGTIKLGGAWSDFEADQVLRWDRGFVWRARTRVKSLRGADRFVDGEGSMRWKMLGIVPVMTGEGPEIARAAAGRFHAEALWLPGALLGDDVQWTALDSTHPHASIRAHGEDSEIDFSIDDRGALTAISLPRWFVGQDGEASHYEPFGGTCGDDRTFGGVTLPTTYRLGWYFGTDRYLPEGEFFRCTLDEVEHR